MTLCAYNTIPDSWKIHQWPWGSWSHSQLVARGFIMLKPAKIFGELRDIWPCYFTLQIANDKCVWSAPLLFAIKKSQGVSCLCPYDVEAQASWPPPGYAPAYQCTPPFILPEWHPHMKPIAAIYNLSIKLGDIQGLAGTQQHVLIDHTDVFIGGSRGVQGVRSHPLSATSLFISYENEIIWSQWDQIIPLSWDI